MVQRPGGKTYIENTFMTAFMQGDEKDLENSYPSKEIAKISGEGHRVLDYLASDMVININCLVP